MSNLFGKKKIEKNTDEYNELIKKIDFGLTKISANVNKIEQKIDEMLFYKRCELLSSDDNVIRLLKKMFYSKSKIAFLIKKMIISEKCYSRIINSEFDDPIKLYCELCWSIDDFVLLLCGNNKPDIIKMGMIGYHVSKSSSISKVFDIHTSSLCENDTAVILLSSLCRIVSPFSGNLTCQGLNYKIDKTEKDILSEKDKILFMSAFLESSNDKVTIKTVENKCNKYKWKNEYIQQLFFKCNDCKFGFGQCVCYNCYAMHHLNHKGKFVLGRAYCDCICLNSDNSKLSVINIS